MDASPAVSVPRLLTPRLRLREYQSRDFDAFAAHLADPLATAYVGAVDRHTAWRIFGCGVGLWLLSGTGWWAVELRATGEMVGVVGAFFREGIPGLELGWNTYREFWGRGIASEAAREALRHAFDERGERQVRALIDPNNAPSIRVAEHLGMRYDADTELYGKPIRR